MTSIWTKLSLWQSENVSWIPVYQSTCISAYKYTSLPVCQSHQSVSIPVHLYTSHSEIQYTSPPVYQSRKYQYTSCQYTSRCRHHATTTWCQHPTSRRP